MCPSASSPVRPAGAAAFQRNRKGIMKSNDIVDTVNRLIEVSKDGELGFRSAAESVNSMELQRLLLARAEACANAVAQLQLIVVQQGGRAGEHGSVTGALHRGWVAVRSTLSGQSDLAVLEECERGEDAALAAYRDATQTDLPLDVRLVVENQYAGVKQNHALIRSLRDRARVAADSGGPRGGTPA
jgi:uncharacterized protein (TIGR02284 family)